MAAQWERNDVVVSVHADGRFADRAAPIEAGAGCTNVDAHRATCPVTDLMSGSIHLWDGDDVYTGPAAPVHL